MDHLRSLPAKSKGELPTIPSMSALQRSGRSRWTERKEANWLVTVPGKGYFAILRLYGPTEAAIDKRWKPGDIEPAKRARWNFAPHV
jgi:hypothetical protein